MCGYIDQGRAGCFFLSTAVSTSASCRLLLLFFNTKIRGQPGQRLQRAQRGGASRGAVRGGGLASAGAVGGEEDALGGRGEAGGGGAAGEARKAA